MSFFIAIVGGFASGIFFRSLFVFGWPVFGLLTLLCVICIIGTLFSDHVALRHAALFFVFVLIGILRMNHAGLERPTVFLTDIDRRVSYEGIVVSDPDVRDHTQRIPVRVTKQKESAVLLAVVPNSTKIMVGDRVHVTGTLSIPEPFAEEDGRIFRYDRYLEARNVSFLLSFGSIRVKSSAPWYSIPAQLARVKHAFLDGLSVALEHPYSALAGGIVIGGKSGLGETLKDAFTRAGLIHIVVLSGYNVMIVAEWVIALLAFTALPKRFAAVCGAGALLLLVGIAGISATAIRAAIMALIALYARATGRTYAAGRALLGAIALMLLWNPLYLVFDPGFGLSVTATAGLIWLAPIIETRLARWNAFWRTTIATTLAAQIAVLPLLLYNTGNFSLVSFPANILAVAAVPFAMGFSALAGFAGMLFGSIAPIIAIAIGFPAYLLTHYLVVVAETSANLPYAALAIPAFPFAVVLLSYSILAYIAFAKRSSITAQLRFAKKASM